MVSVFQRAVQKYKSAQFGAFLVRLLQVEIIRLVGQFENLDALLQVISVSGNMGADLSFQSLLPLYVPAMQIVPHALVNLPGDRLKTPVF
jgi:hypothetical protein